MCKKFICFVFVLGLILTSTANAQDPNLVGWWTFDEGEGTVAADLSGNGYDGTVIGATWVDGLHGGALDMAGVGYVDVPPESWSTIEMQVTISFWAFGDPAGVPNNFIVGAFQDPAVNDSRVLSAHLPWGGTVYFDTGGTAPESGYDRISKGAQSDEYLGDWRLWTFTKDAGTGDQKIYLDGELWHSDVGMVRPMTGVTTFTLGVKPGLAEGWYNGMMDDVKLYDRALTDEEVKALFYRPWAYGPNPANGATSVDTTSLEWIPGTTAVSHKVYLSTDEVIDESDLAGETTVALIVPALEPGATYYWRVDEVDADGTVFEGDVWSFSMMPLEAHFPSPYDGKGNVMLDAQLSWTAGKDAIMHNVYFGTDAAALVPVSMMQMDATYDPGPLEKATTYYWRVDEFAGVATNAGPVWSFTTIGDVPALIDDPNLVGYWTFDEGAHTTALDASGNNRHGSFRGDPQWVAGYEGGALELDGSGDYVNIDGYKGIVADRTDPDNPFQRPFTVACWVNTTTADGSLVCWGSSDGTGVGGQYQNFRINEGRLRAEHGNGRFRGAAIVNDGEWHHVAMAVNEGANLEPPATQLYVDGQMDTQGADTVNAQNIWNLTEDADVGIGVRASHGDRLYTGLFDDVRIYDKALTAEDIAQVMRIDLLEAWNPSPANGSANQVADVTALSWSAGDSAIMHNVHLGTDPAALAPVSMMQMDAIYAFPEAPDLGLTYYWRVDEFNNDGTTTTGRVWNFTVDPFLLVDDMEGYTDYSPDRIFDVWMDGWEIPANGSIVGYPRPDFAAGEHFVETGIVHGGSQSMPYFYDTNYKYSEATMTLGYPRDWTEQGVGELSLWFQGRPAAMVEEPAGTYTMTAAGNDIWGSSDQFRYAYKQLSGDATITARVVDVGTGSNAWSKGGVMIRQSLDPGSINVSGFITGGSGNGGTFQWRPVQGEASSSNRTLTGIAPPYYVQLVREGNTFTVYMSADGVDWAQEGADPVTIEMTDPILIGLAVTSHQSGEMRTYTFDNVSTTGSVSGEWQVATIGADMPSNDPAPMYVAVANSDGTTAAVYNDNPNAALIGNWTKWAINLQDFADQGVDLTDVDKISIGFGDKDNLQAGGSGIVFIDDIRLFRPPELVAAFAFGSRLLDCPTYNVPAVNYTMVHHESPVGLEYDPARGWGYEVIYPTDSPYGNRGGYGVFGPFDDSPNNRGYFGDDCPEQLYDSFIGAKDFTNDVNEATMGDMDTPGDPPEGIIFRVDVPNGLYRFVGAFGEAENHHACRLVAEDGGAGPPANIGANSVVLVHNHDQAQYDIGEAREDRLGAGVFARVGFDGRIPPLGDGVFPDPQFVNMDENGMPTGAGASSPILEVTQGYIRIHQLQGNSNDGPGGARDANGGDIVILELWNVGP
jgi:hypothetical protein